MKRSFLETVVGFLVLVIAGGFIIHVLSKTGGVESKTEGQTVKAEFGNIGAVGVGTAVKIGGVKIGAVSNVELGQNPFIVTVSMAVDGDYKIPFDSTARINSEGLLGGSFVEIVPGYESEYLTTDNPFVDNTSDALDLMSMISKVLVGSGSGTN